MDRLNDSDRERGSNGREGTPGVRRSLSQLPSLNALRAFAVAARHLSFARAASELHVTPAAISQQIRLLEEVLGRDLFRRTNRQLFLSDAAQAALPALNEAFARLVDAVAELEAGDRRQVLTVSVAPSFAIKWLLPRIERFGEVHPDIDLRISASTALVDFAREAVDCAIRYGGGGYQGLSVDKLLSESVVPVAAPELIARDGPLDDPTDLGRFTLLHDASPDLDASCPDWAMWLKAAGVRGIDASRGPHFNQSSMVLEAALLGRGIALAKLRLAEADLRAGRLIRLFGYSVPVGFAYFLVAPAGSQRAPRLEAFRDWLLGEAAREDGADQLGGV